GEALRDGVLALSVLRAIDAAPREQARDMRDSDAEHLFGQDVIDAFLKVRYFVRETFVEAAGDLTQEDTRLRTRVEEGHVFIRPNIRAVVTSRPCLGKGVKHSVSELRRCEDFIVREVGDARQN